MKLCKVEKNVKVTIWNNDLDLLFVDGILNTGKRVCTAVGTFEERGVKYIYLYRKRYVVNEDLTLNQWKLEKNEFGLYDYCF